MAALLAPFDSEDSGLTAAAVGAFELDVSVIVGGAILRNFLQTNNENRTLCVSNRISKSVYSRFYSSCSWHLLEKQSSNCNIIQYANE